MFRKLFYVDETVTLRFYTRETFYFSDLAPLRPDRDGPLPWVSWQCLPMDKNKNKKQK